ncbi:MAG: hypothetical protein QNJ70_18515 [Xenococcaceae cyanobacterium MO_207.B15]|nr:hypothetical protein [Xenococcaceae cyanobacterium MO_207.B15]
MTQKLPDIIIQLIVNALQKGKLIQKQARLCDLAALDAIASEILPYLKLSQKRSP